MGARTSFINKAIIKKNVTLYWPIWVCYLLYLLVKVPGILWFELGRQKVRTESVVYWCLYRCLNLKWDLMILVIMVVVCGMALFGYLYSAKSAYMIHALPVTRTELFVTNVLSGLGFMMIPQLLTFILTVLICLANGIACVQYVAMWLASVMGFAFFLYALVCFCAMLTGLLFALPMFFFVLNYLTEGLAVGIRFVLSCIGYGIDYDSTPDLLFLKILSPAYYLYGRIQFEVSGSYTGQGVLETGELRYSGGRVLLGYMLVALPIYLIAHYCCRKRRSESAGDLLSFAWFKPVFRWGVGCCVGYLAGILAREFLSLVQITLSIPLLFLLITVFGILAFYVADMFVQKSFRVFTRRRFWECVYFFGFSVLTFGTLFSVCRGMEAYIPKQEKISAAYLYRNYPVEFQGEEISHVIEVQQEILAHAEALKKQCKSTEDTGSITLIYDLTNGKRVERTYEIPYQETWCEKLMETLYSYEAEPENFLHYMVGYDYDQITTFMDAELEFRSGSTGYISRPIDVDVAGKIYQAVVEDAKAKVLQKYNLYNALNTDEESEEEDTVYLSFSYLHAGRDWEDAFLRAGKSDTSYRIYLDEKEQKYGYLSLSFGEDCTHILQALQQEGVISSADDLLPVTK